MSAWTYISGVITVSPMGRTQAEKRYILETVLDHLPVVSGSEADMYVHIVQKAGYDCSSSHNELGESMYQRKTANASWRDRSFKTQSQYMLVVEASLRDRFFEQTLAEFNKWLVRLAKRVGMDGILVSVKGYNSKNYERKEYIFKDHKPYDAMFEAPSWNNETGEPNWCEYLMWDSAKNANYPMKLMYKYYDDAENDAEYERRIKYEYGEDEKG